MQSRGQTLQAWVEYNEEKDPAQFQVTVELTMCPGKS